MIGSGALVIGCAAYDSGSGQTTGAAQPDRSILASATPAPGSAAKAPVDELMLRFSPPARLDEVTITGSSGVMPTMVHAVGEVADYSIPLSGLEAGNYTVRWRATAQGGEYQGSFGFTVE